MTERTTVRRPRGTPAPGFTVCLGCRATVDNRDLVEVVRPGKTKGKRVCGPCGQRVLDRQGRP